MTAHSLDAAGLRALMGTFRDALVAHRTTLNLLNVYPVPDGDTGSNMTMTVDSVCSDLEALDPTADRDAVVGAWGGSENAGIRSSGPACCGRSPWTSRSKPVEGAAEAEASPSVDSSSSNSCWLLSAAV